MGASVLDFSSGGVVALALAARHPSAAAEVIAWEPAALGMLPGGGTAASQRGWWPWPAVRCPSSPATTRSTSGIRMSWRHDWQPESGSPARHPGPEQRAELPPPARPAPATPKVVAQRGIRAPNSALSYHCQPDPHAQAPKW